MNNHEWPEEAAVNYVQVAVTLQREEKGIILTVDPWSNCPSAEAREDGLCCSECEYWGRRVEALDWNEFSVCLFTNEE
jgi:hypothetical protein